ncbi:MAG: HlyD family secretion protein [Bryobacteraceae bacterium]|jgi:membrane fusion protein (multidrug efflux system)
MPEPIPTSPPAQTLKKWLVPAAILLAAAFLIVLVTVNWNAWTADRPAQVTDDAYLRADLTPLSTKAAGLVAKVAVSDYQLVKSGDLLIQLRDDDFQAQVREAEASLAAAQDGLVNNDRQKQLQDAKITEAADGVHAAEADTAAAEAGIEAANATISGAKSGIAAAQADVERTGKERRRQEALIGTESTTPQKLEQAVADEERLRSQLAARQADLASASAQLASRKADLARAEARLQSSRSAREVEKRQRAVLDSQESQLRSEVNLRKAGLALAQTNLGYTRILAPENGIVSERLVRPGQLVSPGTQVISLVQSDVWVQANYKETQLPRIRSGDFAEIRVDGVPGTIFKGRVDQVAPASGSQFALLPPDNATGNFTKVVQRVPVKIVLDPNQQAGGRLRPGLSVIATVHTNTVRQ